MNLEKVMLHSKIIQEFLLSRKTTFLTIHFGMTTRKFVQTKWIFLNVAFLAIILTALIFCNAFPVKSHARSGSESLGNMKGEKKLKV